MTIGVGGGTTIGSGITLDGGNVSLPTISAYTPAFTSFVPDPLTYTATQTGYTVANGATNYQVVLTGQGSGPAYNTVSVASPPANGTVLISGTSIYYTPTASYSGTDSFVLTLSAAGATEAVTVNLTVLPPVPNYASIQNFNVVSTAVNYPVTLTGNTGVGTGYTSVSLYSAPVPAGGGTSGTVTISGTNIYYTPRSTYSGYETFVLRLANSGGTEQVTVNMYVIAPMQVFSYTNSTFTYDVGTPVSSVQPLSVLSGGLPPYTWSISGALPTGLQLFAGNGVVAGTPTVVSTNPVTVSVVDSIGTPGPTTSTITFVTVAGITATANTSSPALYVGTALSSFQPLTAANGKSPYIYSYTGTLPPGLTYVGGILSGTPTGSAGTYTATFSVRDSAGVPTTAATTSTVTFTVRSQFIFTPGLYNSSNMTLEASVPFTYSVFGSVTGGVPPYVYSVVGSLPAGLGASLNTTTGVLSGIPTASNQLGSVPFQVQDSLGTYASLSTDAYTNYTSFLYNIVQNITAGNNPTAQSWVAGTSVSFYPFTGVVGGITPYTYYVSSGTLPTGVAINSSTGQVSGTPTAGYSGTVVFSVRDVNNITAATTSTVSITVTGSITATANTTSRALSLNVAITAFQPLTASGGTTPYVYTVTPALPTGLTLNATTGQVTGTPTVTSSATNYTFSVRDANNVTASTTSTVSFTVVQPTYTTNYLVVGGGGGGWQGAAGGAGGVVCGTLSLSPGTTYTIVIGQGAAGTGIAVGTVNRGNPSTFSGGGLLVTALGGGGAWNGGGPGGNGGAPGGSGGGSLQPAPIAPGGTATQPSQPQSVGTSGTYNNRGFPGGVTYGGGGGAGAVGTSRSPTVLIAPGGAGYTWPYTATAYAGGGGGSNLAAAAGGTGGVGGGGAGGPGAVPGSGKNATYYGGGGGAWGQATVPGGIGPYAGGNGYQGVVILAIPTPGYPGSAPGATITTPPAAPGMTVLTFTAPGTYTA
jgi:Putative Ig domain